jgi:hypothetical protein
MKLMEKFLKRQSEKLITETIFREKNINHRQKKMETFFRREKLNQTFSLPSSEKTCALHV